MVGAILIGVLHIFVSTGYPISHKKFKNVHLCKQLWHFKIMLKVFSQLVPSLQKLAILATFLPYQNRFTLWGYLDIPIFFSNEKYHLVPSMIKMFSIMSSIFKTWTMLNAVQVNLLVSQKVLKKGLRWGYSDKRTFKSGGNVSFVFEFLFRYFLYFLRNNLTCMFQTLTA